MLTILTFVQLSAIILTFLLRTCILRLNRVWKKPSLTNFYFGAAFPLNSIDFLSNLNYTNFLQNYKNLNYDKSFYKKKIK